MFVYMPAIGKSTLASGGLFRSLIEGQERALKVSEKSVAGAQVSRNSSEISGAKMEPKQSLIML